MGTLRRPGGALRPSGRPGEVGLALLVSAAGRALDPPWRGDAVPRSRVVILDRVSILRKTARGGQDRERADASSSRRREG